MPLFHTLLLSAGLLTGNGISPAPDSLSSASYKVTSVPLPEGLGGQVGALEFLPDGRLAAAFSSGEIMFYDRDSGKWSLFVHGLHEPLGMQVLSNSQLIVMQRPELTRISDTDGDGKADLFETLSDDFGITGNYHEYNYGPVKGPDGNYYIALNSGSPGGGIRKEVRGRLDSTSMLPRQMFSAVPYRGWVMQLTPDGRLHPYACGFRSPNGLGFDSRGNLFATDNQGDWIGTSPLHHIKKGRFYGHPASLVWRKGWNKGAPGLLPIQQLDSMRTRAAVLFPHGVMANSPSQPLCDLTKGKFGPFTGQLFVGEMNSPRIVRLLLEEVDGEIQGACIPFLDGKGLRKGNNRLAFAPDGTLWTGQNDHGWAGDRGIQYITYTGKKPMEVLTMHLTADGFEITFTQPVGAASTLNREEFRIKSYYYNYHSKYGSDQMEPHKVDLTAISLSPDRKKLKLTLSEVLPGRVYEMHLPGVVSASGAILENRLICYTLNRLQKKQAGLSSGPRSSSSR